MGPALKEGPTKERDVENLHALGGMRNPHLSAQRLPKSGTPGQMVRLLFRKAQELWPDLRDTAKAILTGEHPPELPAQVVSLVRNTTITLLGGDKESRRRRTAKATTPISSEVMAAWGAATSDPDATTLASWLDHGAPLGFNCPIETKGVFPQVGPPADAPDDLQIVTELREWQNYKSAEEEREDLDKLISEYVEKGWCRLLPSIEAAELELGEKVTLNKLGVVVKFTESGNKKSRVVWDLRRSGANAKCHQAERIVLPRLTDLAAAATRAYRSGKEPWLVALDVRDAFLNIPAGKDKAFTVAAKPGADGLNQVIVCDTLVFGAKSSPTIWGRFASLLGRSWASIEPAVRAQIYVDDPAMVVEGSKEEAISALTNILLWAGVLGFPLKLSKAEGGKTIRWIGAVVKLHDDRKEVEVTIPLERKKKLLGAVREVASKPIVSRKALASLAGGLSFVAGLVPHLRPFLDSFWAALSGPSRGGITNDGASVHSGRLIHVRRIERALQWVAALLDEEEVPLVRIFKVAHPEVTAEITTDASPWGLGGVLRLNGKIAGAFAEPLSAEVLNKFNAVKGDPKHTTLWEGLALLVAFRLWLPGLGFGAVVRVKSDSLSSLLMLSKGKAKSLELNCIAREIALDQALQLYRLTFLVHIPGVTNLEADFLSRMFSPKLPVKPSQLERVSLTPVTIGEGFWKVKRLTQPARKNCGARAGGCAYRRLPRVRVYPPSFAADGEVQAFPTRGRTVCPAHSPSAEKGGGFT